MATKNESKLNEDEPKIPVFTVLKNGAILKNIFIVNTSPELKSMASISEHEEILTVGRHPDCNITLTHPSISRFHLQIVSNGSLQKLSVIDLSSIHGTWVSEKKIEPSVRVEMEEGDSLRIGGSSRVYRLHWIPLSRAYDFESPFVPASDVLMNEEEIAVEAYQDDNSLPIENKPVQEEKITMVVEMKEEDEIFELVQGDNSLLLENKEIQCLDLVVEGMSSLCYDESSASTVKNEIPSAPPIPDPNYSLFIENDEFTEGPLLDLGEKKEISSPYNGPFGAEHELPVEGVIFDTKRSEFDQDDHAAELLEETENQSPVRKDSRQMEKSLLLVGELLGETENLQDIENMTPPEALYALESPKHENSTAERKSNSLVNFISSCYDEVSSGSERLEETEDRMVSMKDHERRDVLIEYCAPCMTESVNSSSPAGELATEIAGYKEWQTPQSLFAPAGLPQSEATGRSPVRSDKRPTFGSIWSRRGKPASAVQLRTGRIKVDSKEQQNQEITEDKSISKTMFSCLNGEEEEEEEEISTPDKENFIPNTLLRKSLKKKDKLASTTQLRTGKSREETILDDVDSKDDKDEQHNQEATEDKSIPKEIFSFFNGEEEEIFTPDKENFTPNTLLLKSLKKKGKLEEVKHSKSCRASCSKFIFSPNMHLEHDLNQSSNKETQTSRVLQERKFVIQPTSGSQVRLEQEVIVNRTQERVPFQSLVVNSVGKSRSDTLGAKSATRSSSSVNYSQTVEKKITNPLSNNSVREGKRGWSMVVDTTALLNKESRRSLQLLQGLKGTRLTIPRMVIRELDCLKRRGSLFRRKTEACLVLEWIEQCMVETNWWIHLQSSVEDGRLTAPTPPATPTSPFSEGSAGFCHGATSSLPFLSRWSSMEIVSPTTEDHILECALLCRKMNTNGQFVLLSDDITLKIKAMGEGLICETVQEFRESLMNPFSERFLWVDSSPRGQTWSVLDDVVLRDKYNRCPLKKSLKGETAKGLKLILLHNSHYGQRTPIN